MRLEMSNTNPIGFLPTASHVLGRELGRPVFNNDYRCRHPRGLYAISTTTIASRFRRLLNEYFRIEPMMLQCEDDAPKVETETLLEHLDALLDSLMEHHDDCISVLRCFFPVGADYKKNPAVRAFQREVESYRNFIGHRVNHIKHGQGRLRPLFVSDDSRWFAGYFFEGVGVGGGIGPDPEIHRTQEAYSLGRDLRFHLYHVYATGAALATAVQKLGEPSAPLPESNVESSAAWRDLVKDVSRLPKPLFPGESRLDWPEIIYGEHEDLTWADLQISAVSLAPPPEIEPPCRVSAAYQSDGCPNQSFRLPFWHARDRKA